MAGNGASAATLLAVFAHPDDESYICGGTLARYAAAGVRIVLVCATRGKAGEISDARLATPDTLPAVREAELRAAAKVLGLAEVHHLDYRDGALGEVPFLEGVAAVAAALAAARPTIVLTFGPEGVYGHVDHVMVHRWTREAFYLARGAAADEGATPPAARLYYCAPPRSWYRAVSERARARGVHDRYGPRLDVLGVPDELVTTRIEVGAFAETRLAAIRAHPTQLPGDHPFGTLPDADLHELFAAEWFIRHWPARVPGPPLEPDLFATDKAEIGGQASGARVPEAS